MSGGFLLRDEREDDVEAIDRITREAFAGQPYSVQNEHFIVRSLRRAGALTISLVAEDVFGELVGHIAFSPVTISDGSVDWFGLGPLSVMPARQGQGIGKALVAQGLDRLRGLGAVGCLLLGEPSYYGRFGFVADERLRYLGVPREYFQSLLLAGSMPNGVVRFHAAFEATA